MRRYLLRILLLTGFVLIGSRFRSVTDLAPRQVHLNMEPGSYLLIQGESNVNKFQCNYLDLHADTLDVKVYWQDECLVFQDATIRLDIRAFDCGNRQMNRDLQDLLKTQNYPYISIDILCIDVSSTEGSLIIPVRQNPDKIAILTRIRIAGHEKQQRVPVEIFKKDNERNYTGSILLNLKDFNLEPPTKLMGLIRVDKMIEVHFYLKVTILDAQVKKD